MTDISYINPWSKNTREMYRRTGVKVYESKCGKGLYEKGEI